MEKFSALNFIDQAWKEHLRDMDDLKQSVQAAVYEQKDPLLIYKFESFELFKRFLARVNEDTVSFLTKAIIPVQQPEQVNEARRQRSAQNYRESKEESKSLLEGGQGRTRPPVKKVAPAKSMKMRGRNERVDVQYSDGTIKKDIKFKHVEDDAKSKKCTIIGDE
jgi:preprotein translocase subunit SecA